MKLRAWTPAIVIAISACDGETVGPPPNLRAGAGGTIPLAAAGQMNVSDSSGGSARTGGRGTLLGGSAGDGSEEGGSEAAGGTNVHGGTSSAGFGGVGALVGGTAGGATVSVGFGGVRESVGGTAGGGTASVGFGGTGGTTAGGGTSSAGYGGASESVGGTATGGGSSVHSGGVAGTPAGGGTDEAGSGGTSESVGGTATGGGSGSGGFGGANGPVGGTAAGGGSGSGGFGGANGSVGGTAAGGGSGSGGCAGGGGHAGETWADTSLPYPPYCEVTTWHPPVEWEATKSVVVAGTAPDAVILFATQPTHEIVATTWGSLDIIGTWGCEDAVPHPQRIAAINLADWFELFVTTATGKVWWRWQPPPWKLFELPEPTSRVDDVFNYGPASMRGRVYIADRGRVYARMKESVLPFAAWGSWIDLGAPSALRITSGFRGDGQEQLFVVTPTGALRTLLQPNFSTGSASSDWQGIATPAPLSDADCALAANGTLLLYASDQAGGVYRQAFGTGVSPGWETVKAASVEPQILSLSTLSGVGVEPLLVGVDENGQVQLRNDDGTWRLMLK